MESQNQCRGNLPVLIWKDLHVIFLNSEKLIYLNINEIIPVYICISVCITSLVPKKQNHLFVSEYHICACMHAQLCLTLCDLMTVACQAPLSLGFSRREHWSGLPFPPPGDLPNPGIEPMSPVSPALAGGLFITMPPGWHTHVYECIKCWVGHVPGVLVTVTF